MFTGREIRKVVTYILKGGQYGLEDGYVILGISEAVCKVDGCDSKHYAKGFCRKHYRQVLKHDRLTPEREFGHNPVHCTVAGCNNKTLSKGLCSKHYHRKRREMEKDGQ